MPARTMGKGCSGATGSRGRRTPSISQFAAAAAGKRAASCEARSTTRPITARGSFSIRRIPRPRTSISPRVVPGTEAMRRPCTAASATRSSATRRAKGSLPLRAASTSASASRDLPDPAGPRINTARAPTSTQLACTVSPTDSGMDHVAGRRTTKRAPAIFGSPPGAGGVTRFSAQMRPPWASTICREIESPSPEF